MAEAKGKKLRRCNASNGAYYKLQFGITDRNKKRRLSRHIRNHPEDVQAVKRFELDMGRAPLFSSRKALKRLNRTTLSG